MYFWWILLVAIFTKPELIFAGCQYGLKGKLNCSRVTYDELQGYFKNELRNGSNVESIVIHDSVLHTIRRDLFSSPNIDKVISLNFEFTRINYFKDDFLEDMPQIRWLTLTNCTINTLDISYFIRNTTITTIYFSGNKVNKFSDLHKAAELKSYSTLKTMYGVRMPWMEIVDVPFFTNYPVEVLSLVLAFNKIKQIRREYFNSIGKLNNLELNNNEISEIQDDSFANLQQLTYLYLNSNHINRITNGMFRGLVNLNKLELQNNKITKVDTEAFRDVKLLEYLQLHRNNLYEINVEMFSGLSSLRSLTLNDNKIANIERNSFRDLERLEYLFLYSNNILEIQSQTFVGMSILEELYIYHNQIATIQPKAFDGLPKLRTLWLQYNKIEEISDETFYGLTSLNTLNMSYNPVRRIQMPFKMCSNNSNLYLYNYHEERQLSFSKLNLRGVIFCTVISLLIVSVLINISMFIKKRKNNAATVDNSIRMKDYRQNFGLGNSNQTASYLEPTQTRNIQREQANEVQYENFGYGAEAQYENFKFEKDDDPISFY